MRSTNYESTHSFLIGETWVVVSDQKKDNIMKIVSDRFFDSMAMQQASQLFHSHSPPWKKQPSSAQCLQLSPELKLPSSPLLSKQPSKNTIIASITAVAAVYAIIKKSPASSTTTTKIAANHRNRKDPLWMRLRYCCLHICHVCHCCHCPSCSLPMSTVVSRAASATIATIVIATVKKFSPLQLLQLPLKLPLPLLPPLPVPPPKKLPSYHLSKSICLHCNHYLKT